MSMTLQILYKNSDNLQLWFLSTVTTIITNANSAKVCLLEYKGICPHLSYFIVMLMLLFVLLLYFSRYQGWWLQYQGRSSRKGIICLPCQNGLLFLDSNRNSSLESRSHLKGHSNTRINNFHLLWNTAV